MLAIVGGLRKQRWLLDFCDFNWPAFVAVGRLALSI